MLLLLLVILILIALAVVIILNIVPITIGIFSMFGLLFILSPPKHGDRYGRKYRKKGK